MRDPRTICELFQHSLAARSRANAFAEKHAGRYHLRSDREIADRVQAIASTLRQVGVQPGDRVAILSSNRIEWAIADYAILHCGAVTVPVYPTLPATTVQHILGDCDVMLAFVADADQLAKLGGQEQLPHLHHVVVFDATPETEAAADHADAPRSVSDWREFETRGASMHDPNAFERVWQAVKPDDLATIIYTSGTTGVPKGVMLTHANIVSNVLSTLARLPIGPGDTCLSFLPLSHIFERMAGHFVMWYAGVSIAYAESIDTVPQNLLEVRPTILISVPRLYEKMHARVRNTMASASALRQHLFEWAVETGCHRVRIEQQDRRVPPWLAIQSAVADKLVFAKLRERLGGRMRFMISGGAPLSPAIAEFFHAASLLILEGYGLTETAPVITVNPLDRPRLGTVGPAIDGVEVRIAEDGEILTRGPHVMRGYYGMPQETAQVLAGGWFHTGDIGQLDKDGYLRVTDRKKDLLVTSGGKNVAPQPIEARLKASSLIAEAILVGDKQKYVSALLVPQLVALRDHARSIGLAGTDAELVRTPQVLRLYEAVIAQVNTRLAPYERIKRFCLLDRELQLESGEITPTMKVKRNVVTATYASLIDNMYRDPAPAGVGCPPADAHEPQADPVSSH